MIELYNFLKNDWKNHKFNSVVCTSEDLEKYGYKKEYEITNN